MDIRQTVQQHGQQQVLRFWNDLTPAEQATLSAQLQAIDWEHIDEWVATYVKGSGATAIPSELAPAPYYPAVPRDAAEAALYQRAEAAGADLLRAGRVAAFTVAGGQGTRLGFDAPKGTFPIGPVSQRSLFQVFAESLLRQGEIYGHAIPWYLMTSPVNDAATRADFAANHFFGLVPENVMFFMQGTMPAFALDGTLLLESKSSLALSPDGHGGSLRALHVSGALADMKRRGVEIISYFQVDNPLVSVVNPLFLGLHHVTGSEMSSRTLLKNDPFEKVGVFSLAGGRVMVVEYSDLPAHLATAKNEQGRLHFIAGSPAIHVLSRAFVERLNVGGFQLPFHRAVKKVPCLDLAGQPLTPKEPNGVKLETFVFDAKPLASKTMILEAAREEEFAPVKNPTGVDSVESSRELLQERYARWLTARGVTVPRHANGKLACQLEISARHYVTAADFARASVTGLVIQPGDTVRIPG